MVTVKLIHDSVSQSLLDNHFDVSKIFILIFIFCKISVQYIGDVIHLLKNDAN